MKSSRNVELSEQNNKVKSRPIRASSQRARAGAPSMSFLFLSFNQGFTVFSKYQTKYQKEKNQYQQAKQINTRNISNLNQRLWVTNKHLENGGRCKPDVRKQRKNPVMTSSWKKNNSIRQGGDTNTYTTKHKPTSDKGRLLEIGNSDVVRCLWSESILSLREVIHREEPIRIKCVYSCIPICTNYSQWNLACMCHCTNCGDHSRSSQV